MIVNTMEMTMMGSMGLMDLLDLIVVEMEDGEEVMEVDGEEEEMEADGEEETEEVGEEEMEVEEVGMEEVEMVEDNFYDSYQPILILYLNNLFFCLLFDFFRSFKNFSSIILY